jgi:hypothetical protein
MLAHFIHYIIAQDSENGIEWGNILFIAIFIAFWAVNTLLRITAKKRTKEHNSDDKTTDAPKMRKKSLVETMLQEVLGGSEQKVTKPKSQQRPIRRTRPVVKKPSKVFSKQQKFLEKTIPDDAFSFDSAPDVLKETKDIKVSNKYLRMKSLPVSVGKASKAKEQISPRLSISQYFGEGRGELEKAILYYEILGKPLSLRETQSSLF